MFFIGGTGRFRPRYSITNRLLASITKATAGKEFVTQVSLPPDWVGNFRIEAMARSAHGATFFEGNPLDLSEVTRLVAERQRQSPIRAQQQVLNYVRALESADVIVNSGKLTEEQLLWAHYTLTEGTLDDPAGGGTYRKSEVASTAGLRYAMAPQAKDVPALTRHLLGWLESFETEKLNATIQSGIVHHEIMRIRPFTTGNGLLAKYLSTVVLYLRRFDSKRLFVLDDYYNENREAYFKALESGEGKNADLTGWLEYFADGVAQAVAKVKARVVSMADECSRGGRPETEPRGVL